jgi:NtrC-family two-component system sensor histidine kinase KinB
MEGQAKAQNIEVRRQIEPDLPRLDADPLRLRAVFDNILSNALKYTPSGGCITVDARRTSTGTNRDRETVSISIADTGPGVPVAFRARIFEKFFRLEHHQSDGHVVARGAGIGLYMCRQIVELHGGRIVCTSGPNDKGTRITVTFPAAIGIEAPPLKDAPTYVS